jgi:hypothetical protein
MRLVRIIIGHVHVIEYAVFGHKPQQRFVNYVDVRAEIENDTRSVVRDDMGVSNLPINLTIFSPHGKTDRVRIRRVTCPMMNIVCHSSRCIVNDDCFSVVNLTLVDLPGMVKVPSQGQPADIVKKIDDIILEYITNENCLILAVTPANIDLVTSDALVMARSRDPMGKRTIGVLTKLDMMAKGQNAREVLLNKVVVLERGTTIRNDGSCRARNDIVLVRRLHRRCSSWPSYGRVRASIERTRHSRCTRTRTTILRQ